MTGIEIVYLHLRRHRVITRLADVVHKMRRRGFVVDTELVPHKGTRYARYRLVR